MPNDLLALIERVEKATGPDRDLDAAVFVAVTGAATWSYDDNCHIDALIKSGAYRGDKQLHPDYAPNPRVTWRYRIGDADYGEVPSLSASVDAALALLERVLPGAFWHMAKGKLRAGEPLYAFQLLFGADEVIGEAEHNDLCLAIIAATLRAMHQEIGPRNRKSRAMQSQENE